MNVNHKSTSKAPYALSFHAIGSTTLCIVLLLALAGCVTAPKQYEYQKKWNISSSFDSTWQALIDIFVEEEWHFDNVEKDSGVITTEWLVLFDDNETTYADYGSCGLMIPIEDQVRFNVLVRRTASTSTLEINAKFRQFRQLSDTIRYYNGNSKGALEREIYEKVSKRLGLAPEPANQPATAGDAKQKKE